MSGNPNPHSLSLFQINLHHSIVATANLSRLLNVMHTSIALIQEPYATQGSVRGLCGTVLCKHSEDNPRACIYISPDSNAMLLSNFCSRDLVAARVDYRTKEGERMLVVCSAYLPFDSPSPPPPPELMELVEFCKSKNWPLLIGCDANAHHIAWGSSNINPRGRALLEFLATTDLEILNRGNEPTFLTSTRSEVIDITLGSPSVAQVVNNWHVAEETSFSDHRYICFGISAENGLPRTYRVPKATNWGSYRESLQGKVGSIPFRARTAEDIELAVTLLQDAIISSYEENCPLRTVKTSKGAPWWDSSLDKARRTTRQLFNKAKQSKNPLDWAEYKNSMRSFKSAIRRKKRESWRSYCEKIEDLPQAVRLQKVLAKDPREKLGALKCPSGSTTASHRETLEELLRVHFPGSLELNSSEIVTTPQLRANRSKWESACQIIGQNRIRWAIFSFAPYKSPGMDGIFPALLQEAIEILIQPLYYIFKACLALGYIPCAWRDAKVIFIPKPGRTSYTEAKSFRPISLTSFLLKSLERLVDRYIRDEVFGTKPFHFSQHAYQAGKSTETALHQIVNTIEVEMDQGGYALGTFLDIEGAFDNVTFQSMCNAMEACGVEPLVVDWTRAMLSSRIIHASSGHESVRVIATQGCPQGGVLSPLLWNLVVDGLLTRLSESGVFTQGYADDVVLMVRGKYLNTVCELTQRALKTVESWCLENGLSVSHTKTKTVLFTRKRKMTGFKAPVLHGIPLNTSNWVKYLGIYLDSKLSWKVHLEMKERKATAALWACRRTLGPTWGLSPKVTHWYYTAVIRPMILYGSLVWWTCTNKQWCQSTLQRVQRLACLNITGAFKTTPTAAMEAFLGLPPLHIMAEGEARRASVRLHSIGQWNRMSEGRGHGSIRLRLGDNLYQMGSDPMLPLYSFEKKFKIEIPSRQDWISDENTLLRSKGPIWFTDGSRKDDSAGAGIFGQFPKARLTFPLGKYVTVFQAEIFAISACVQENLRRGPKGQHILILSDSQAALKALNSFKFDSRLVWECFNLLRELAMHNNVTLRWIPGHCGIEGNEEADALARKGSDLSLIGPEPRLPISKATQVQAIKSWISQQHADHWRVQELRQSSLFFVGPSAQFTKNLLLLSKKNARLMVGLLTGHCPLNKHLTNMRIRNDPMCRVCLEDEETPLHILCFCDALADARAIHLGQPYAEPGEIERAPFGNILSFMRKTGLSGVL